MESKPILLGETEIKSREKRVGFRQSDLDRFEILLTEALVNDEIERTPEAVLRAAFKRLGVRQRLGVVNFYADAPLRKKVAALLRDRHPGGAQLVLPEMLQYLKEGSRIFVDAKRRRYKTLALEKVRIAINRMRIPSIKPRASAFADELEILCDAAVAYGCETLGVMLDQARTICESGDADEIRKLKRHLSPKADVMANAK